MPRVHATLDVGKVLVPALARKQCDGKLRAHSCRAPDEDALRCVGQLRLDLRRACQGWRAQAPSSHEICCAPHQRTCRRTACRRPGAWARTPSLAPRHARTRLRFARPGTPPALSQDRSSQESTTAIRAVSASVRQIHTNWLQSGVRAPESHASAQASCFAPQRHVTLWGVAGVSARHPTACAPLSAPSNDTTVHARWRLRLTCASSTLTRVRPDQAMSDAFAATLRCCCGTQGRAARAAAGAAAAAAREKRVLATRRRFMERRGQEPRGRRAYGCDCAHCPAAAPSDRKVGRASSERARAPTRSSAPQSDG